MARFFPADPPNNYASELAVRSALARLDDRWRVFHSVSWQSERHGRQGDGEADFVLLHPDHGLIVLEVKGGNPIEVESGQWFSTNSRTHERSRIKNPFEQAKDSKYALLRYLESVAPRLAVIPICHGVAFPGVNYTEMVAPYAPRAITIDIGDLSDIGQAVDRIVDHWGHNAHVSREDVDELTRRIAPTTAIRRRLVAAVDAANDELLMLTEQQKAAFRITRSRRRAAISGGPGTGKTVLAVERAIGLADDGFRVLLVCFNRPLADQIGAAISNTNVTVRTFHSLCLSIASSAGFDVDPETPGWWTDAAPNVLVDAASKSGFQIDAVIVDEAQDFSSTWIDAVRMLLSDPSDGICFVFYDPRQALMNPRWDLPSDLDTFPLDWNCRNTLSIARKVAAVYDDEPLAIGTEGESPQWIKADSIDVGIRATQELVDRLVREESVLPRQIAVLSNSRLAVDRLQGMVISDASFCAYGAGHGVVAETIYRFKGLEADLVVLLLVDDKNSEAELRQLAYVGMSRARTHLIVIGPKSLRKVLSWDPRPQREAPQIPITR